jgi:hypothetical protein
MAQGLIVNPKRTRLVSEDPVREVKAPRGWTFSHRRCEGVTLR